MQLGIDFSNLDTKQLELAPYWSTDNKYYTIDHAKSSIKSLDKTLKSFRAQNFSNHMDSYWNDGIKFYTEWIKVLDGLMDLKEFEIKWESIFKK